MKLLSFHYHLKIRMDAFVNGHRFILRCIPVSDDRQRILKLDRYVFPYDFLRDAEDQWGNAYLYGRYREPHTFFEANVCGQAVAGLCSGTASVNPAREEIFRYATPLTQVSGGLAQKSGRPGTGVRSVSTNSSSTPLGRHSTSFCSTRRA